MIYGFIALLALAALVYVFRDTIKSWLLAEEAVLQGHFNAEVDKLKADITALKAKVL